MRDVREQPLEKNPLEIKGSPNNQPFVKWENVRNTGSSWNHILLFSDPHPSLGPLCLSSVIINANGTPGHSRVPVLGPAGAMEMKLKGPQTSLLSNPLVKCSCSTFHTNWSNEIHLALFPAPLRSSPTQAVQGLKMGEGATLP